MENNIVLEVVNKRAQLLDVRTKEEWETGHAKPAINIPLSDLNEKTMGNLSKNRPIYVYCQSGNRSGQATSLLKQKGYDAHNLGGLHEWQSAGGEITR